MNTPNGVRFQTNEAEKKIETTTCAYITLLSTYALMLLSRGPFLLLQLQFNDYKFFPYKMRCGFFKTKCVEMLYSTTQFLHLRNQN